jgi:hypothetical protein
MSEKGRKTDHRWPEADLQRAGVTMDYFDAMLHRNEGRRVVRIGWGSLRERKELTDEDMRADDWVVLPEETRWRRR